MNENVHNITASKTLNNVEAYFQSHDVQYLAEDAVFIDLSTGEETRGREAIADMLSYIYHVAFEAKAVIKNQVITHNKAFIEADFRGRHIGDFAGIPATNKEVNVPLCVSYDIEDGLIKTARIYMLVSVLFQQLQGES